MTDRGQAHTLEAVVGAMILLSSVMFALQVTAVTPLTGSTSNQHIERQQTAMAEGVLAGGAANGSLESTLLYYNATRGQFHGASDDGYVNGGPPTDLGRTLNRTFRSRGIAFDVTVYFVRAGGGRDRVNLVDLGTPSDNAAVVSRTVTLFDDDRLRDASGAPTGERVGDTDDYFAPDVAPNSSMYNVLDVEVTVWRM